MYQYERRQNDYLQYDSYCKIQHSQYSLSFVNDHIEDKHNRAALVSFTNTLAETTQWCSTGRYLKELRTTEWCLVPALVEPEVLVWAEEVHGELAHLVSLVLDVEWHVTRVAHLARPPPGTRGSKRNRRIALRVLKNTVVLLIFAFV